MGWDADAVSSHLHRLASVEDCDPIGPIALARRLGIAVLRAPRGGQHGDAWTSGLTIFVAPRLPLERLVFAVAHELAEWVVGDSASEHTEHLCDAAAAAIIAPRAAFLGWHADVGDDLPALAAAFRVTETCMAMRLGEVTGRPVIVVAPGHAHVRGEPWEWGDIGALRSRDLPRGVERVRLTDDARRIVVSAA